MFESNKSSAVVQLSDADMSKWTSAMKSCMTFFNSEISDIAALNRLIIVSAFQTGVPAEDFRCRRAQTGKSPDLQLTFPGQCHQPLHSLFQTAESESWSRRITWPVRISPDEIPLCRPKRTASVCCCQPDLQFIPWCSTAHTPAEYSGSSLFPAGSTSRATGRQLN